MFPFPFPFAAGGPEFLDILKDLKTKNTDLDAKVGRAVESLKEASSLVEELDRELAQRMDVAEQLQARYEKYKRLSDAHEEEAEAFLKEMEAILNKGKGKERAVNFVLSFVGGLIIFILGVVFGPTIQSWFGA
jgi:DNA repair exonuclease SbcCD ATPase subunit